VRCRANPVALWVRDDDPSQRIRQRRRRGREQQRVSVVGRIVRKRGKQQWVGRQQQFEQRIHREQLDRRFGQQLGSEYEQQLGDEHRQLRQHQHE